MSSEIRRYNGSVVRTRCCLKKRVRAIRLREECFKIKNWQPKFTKSIESLEDKGWRHFQESKQEKINRETI